MADADPKLALDERLFERASRLDVFRPFRGCVPWRYEPRKSGPPRAVVSLPIALNTSHHMAAELIYARVDAAQHIFHWRGRGRDRLARTLAHLMQHFGQHVLLADVRRCFASANIDAIAALDLLPPELIRNALDHRSLRFRRYGDPIGVEETEQTVPQGLLEGSAASNPLAAALFNDLAGHVGKRVVPLMFGDNIAIVAATKEACSSAEENLGRYFADHFAGPFSLTSDYFGPRERFDFLGYSFNPETDGTVCIHHSTANWAKMMRKLCHEMNLVAFSSPDEALAKLLNGFPALSDEYRENLLALVTDEFETAHRMLSGNDATGVGETNDCRQ